jgi:hypothetical protein
MTIIQAIRESVQDSIQNSLFVYGRNSDTALESAKELNIGTFVYLEPIQKTGNLTDGFLTDNITIGFLTQDEPDSSSDEDINEESIESMEQKVAEMENVAIDWLDYFCNNYTYSLNGNYNLQPVFRIKNVMTGGLLTFQFIEPKQC